MIWTNVASGPDQTSSPSILDTIWTFSPEQHSSSNGDSIEEEPVMANVSICEICHDDVVVRGSRFGLLENCEHVFCLECIREWRAQREKQDKMNLRKCPVCRVDSFLIVPSSEFQTGLGKATERESYVKYLSMIPCKYGKGKCQFGSSCLYFHEADEGTAAAADVRIVKGADGKARAVKGSNLLDFLK
jgi:hypothetical protein